MLGGLARPPPPPNCPCVSQAKYALQVTVLLVKQELPGWLVSLAVAVGLQAAIVMCVVAALQ